MAQLDEILTKYVKPGAEIQGLQGSALIVKDRHWKTLYSNALGKLNYEPESPPCTTGSVCWIASMTKLLTAVSVMQLVEKKKVGLDNDLGKLIPELSNVEVLKGFGDDRKPIMEKKTKPITLRGFAYDALDPDLTKWSTAMGRTENCMTHSLEGFTVPLKFQPGGGWVYGVGIDWAAYVVQVVSGLSFEDYMEEHIFKPLVMSSTTFRMPKRRDLAERRAPIGYRAAPGGPLGAGPTPVPDSPSMLSGGAGLYSTADRIAGLGWRSTEAGVPSGNGEIHSYLTTKYPKCTPASYGPGGALNLEDLPQKRRKGSMMWSGMANTHWWIDGESGIAATLFLQVLPPFDSVVSAMFDELERAIYKDLVA